MFKSKARLTQSTTWGNLLLFLVATVGYGSLRFFSPASTSSLLRLAFISLLIVYVFYRMLKD